DGGVADVVGGWFDSVGTGSGGAGGAVVDVSGNTVVGAAVVVVEVEGTSLTWVAAEPLLPRHKNNHVTTARTTVAPTTRAARRRWPSRSKGTLITHGVFDQR